MIVLIPGLTCDERIWADQRVALQHHHDVTIPRLHDFDSIEDMACSILDATSGRLDVVGHSMGGRVAFELIRLAPDRVHSLVVMDTGAHPVAEGEAESRKLRVDIATIQGMRALARDWVPAMVDPSRIQDAVLIDAITDMVVSYTTEQYVGQIRALLTRRDATSNLASIECPTLVACGRHDSWSPLSQHREMHARIRNARLSIVEDAGHMISMERPEDTTKLLLEWFAEREKEHR